MVLHSYKSQIQGRVPEPILVQEVHVNIWPKISGFQDAVCHSFLLTILLKFSSLVNSDRRSIGS